MNRGVVNHRGKFKGTRTFFVDSLGFSASGNHRGGVDLQQQLGARQGDDLHHRAGGKVRPQDFAAGFVDIAMVAHIGGEDAQRMKLSANG